MSGIPLRLAVVVLAASALPGSALAQERKEKKQQPDLKTFMCKRGKLVFEDPVTEESFKENWRVYKGKYVFDGGKLKVAEIASDGHHPAASKKIDLENMIVQFSFRIDGAKWLGFSWDGKAHVARAMITPQAFRIQGMSGIGGTTKSYAIDETKYKFEPDRWYTMLVEIYGDEMVAQVDNVQMALGRSERVKGPKTRIELISGGHWAWFSGVKIWEALPDKAWPARKRILAQRLRKKLQ